MTNIISVLLVNDELHSCPFMSDLNSCRAMKESRINHCPVLVDEDAIGEYTAPDDCPLRQGDVIVRFKEVVE